VSAVAVEAAVGIRVPGPRSGPRRLRSVPKQADALPSGFGHPLALGLETRARLHGAVKQLLATPGLVGAPDAVRLAAVVLAAKTPDASGWVEITTRELGRWVGLSQSHTASEVLPALRSSQVAGTKAVKDGRSRKVTGLRCAVLPLWSARDVAGHALALTRPELATLLHLIEALFAPGWRLKGGEGWSTAPGLLGTGTGATAAADRLALLLLVLECGSDGRVPLCGGRADKRHGRLATTLARRMSCTPSRAARILARLEGAGLVDRRRVETVSGLNHKARLLVPSVAAAHGAAVPADRVKQAQEQVLVAANAVIPDPSPAADGGEVPAAEASPQLPGLDVTEGADVSDPAPAADIHTDHAVVAVVVGDACAVDGFSGEAEVVARHRRPERECVREEAPVGAGPQLRVVGGPVLPLRGEQQNSQPSSKHHETAGQGMGRVALPQDLALALEPVIALWWRLERPGARAKVVLAARGELAVISGMTGTDADRVLADRLIGRMLAQGGPASVRDPVGWLLGRGLPQRRDCGDRRCDDGLLLTTGESCARCQENLLANRAMRSSVAAGVDQRLAPQEQQREVEGRMRELAQLAAEEEQIRWERAAAAPARWTCLKCEVLGHSTGVVHASGLCRTCRGETSREAW
jgi:hypothetical protein